MLSLHGSPNTAWLDVSTEHVLVVFHDRFAKLVNQMLRFFVAISGHLGVSIASDRSFSEFPPNPRLSRWLVAGVAP